MIPDWLFVRSARAGSFPFSWKGPPRLVITDRESGAAKVTVRYTPAAAAPGPWRIDWSDGHVFLTTYQLLDAFGVIEVHAVALGKYSRCGNILEVSVPERKEESVSVLLNREIKERITALVERASSA